MVNSFKKWSILLRNGEIVLRNGEIVLGYLPQETKLLLVNTRACSVKQAILETVEKHNPDCVVTGSRGLGAFGRAFLGSVCDFLVHNSSSPCVIIKCKDEPGQ